MAGAVPKTALDAPALGGAPAALPLLAWLGAARWLPPLLLALGTILALMAAYSVRPSVAVDIGDYLDTPLFKSSGFTAYDGISRFYQTIGYLQIIETFGRPARSKILVACDEKTAFMLYDISPGFIAISNTGYIVK